MPVLRHLRLRNDHQAEFASEKIASMKQQPVSPCRKSWTCQQNGGQQHVQQHQIYAHITSGCPSNFEGVLTCARLFPRRESSVLDRRFSLKATFLDQPTNSFLLLKLMFMLLSLYVDQSSFPVSYCRNTRFVPISLHTLSTHS